MCTLGHVKISGIVDALNLRRLKFDASTAMYFTLLETSNLFLFEQESSRA